MPCSRIRKNAGQRPTAQTRILANAATGYCAKPNRVRYSQEFNVRVLLTGGYGCIGSWIVRNLLERGDLAWIYDLKQDPRRMRQILRDEQIRQVAFVPGDVTDLDNLKTTIRTHGI